ncbi:hypothetical protein BH23ACT9_BH23ACT9_06290 [soil metagenome]
MPLAGLFTIKPPDELFTTRGVLRADNSNWVFRTAHNAQAESGYRVYVEPHGTAPHSGGCPTVAWLPSSGLHLSVARAIIDALDDAPTTTVVTPPGRAYGHPDEVQDARSAVDAASETFDSAALALASPKLSDRQRQRLQTEVDAREAELDLAEQTLGELQARTRAPDETQDVAVPMKNLPDALAALSLGTSLPPALADSVRRLLIVVLRAPTMWLDPDSGTVQWSATLELETDTSQTLRIPIAGQTRNCSADTWLGGPGSMVWVWMSFPDAWAQLDNQTAVGLTSHWRKPIIERLLQEDWPSGLRLRDHTAARLLVGCPSSALVRAALGLLRGGAVEPDVSAAIKPLFFDEWTETCAPPNVNGHRDLRLSGQLVSGLVAM